MTGEAQEPRTPPVPTPLEGFKDAQRSAWEGGDYPAVAHLIEPAAQLLVEQAHVQPGQRVLDVATGSGSVAVLAARAGAAVVGVDHTDAWFEEARTRARAEGVEVELRVGDAEALPVADASFDVVLSSFGAIFAPRHSLVAAELTRACRPRGTIAFTAWSPGTASERVFSVIGEHLPALPDFAQPFIRWGDPDHVEEQFTGLDVAFRFGSSSLAWEFPSVEAFEAFLFASSGPLIAARRALEDRGAWAPAHADLQAAIRQANEADDGTCRLTLDYLYAVGVRAG